MLYNKYYFPFCCSYLSWCIPVLACPNGKYNDQTGLICTGKKCYKINLRYILNGLKSQKSRTHDNVNINSHINCAFTFNMNNV